jgi:flagellar hook assembly protein FlgD
VPVPARAAVLNLQQNRPNPFRSGTVIEFSLTTRTGVTLAIFDVSGRLVRQLLDSEPLEAGDHRMAWDGSGADGQPVASGIYFYRLVSGGRKLQKALHLLR